MNWCHAWTLDVANIECGNTMFIRCGFEGAAGGAGPPGEGAAISINLAAKWTVGRLVSVQRTQRGATPPRKAHRSSQSDSISGGVRSRESSGKQHKTFKGGKRGHDSKRE